MIALETPLVWIRNICRENGLEIDDGQALLLEAYVVRLLEWNRKVNLISRKDEDRVWQNHILHSISPLFKIKLAAKSAILDLGTGGGMPGIPLRIMLPDSQFILIDSTQKKVKAVQDMLAGMGVGGIEAIWGRAEDLSKRKDLHSHFDYIVARAVAPLKNLIGWSAPLLRQKIEIQEEGMVGRSYIPPPALIALKGGDLEDEIARAREQRGVRSVETTILVFEGSEDISATEKKIVVVRF